MMDMGWKIWTTTKNIYLYFGGGDPLKIDLYCNDGSPIGIDPSYIYGRGVGGAELALMSWAETMAGRGHDVRIYNSPSRPDDYDGVKYLPQGSFVPSEGRDVFVLFRSPSPHLRTTKADKKIFWSCDQRTVGHYGRDVFPFVDKVVCISPYHVDYHKKHYEIDDDKITYIDLGVRLQDYNQEIEKVPGRCIFCSVPDRGLDLLRIMWPKIKERRPDASLVITADYRLWGSPSPRNHGHRMNWMSQPDVAFLGKISRHQLVKEQLAAVVHPYACTYEELFCISSAECQVAGATSITNDIGALATTNEYGAMPGNILDSGWQERFIDTVVKTMDFDELGKQISEAAKYRFDWQRICQEWEGLIEG